MYIGKYPMSIRQSYLEDYLSIITHNIDPINTDLSIDNHDTHPDYGMYFRMLLVHWDNCQNEDNEKQEIMDKTQYSILESLIETINKSLSEVESIARDINDVVAVDKTIFVATSLQSVVSEFSKYRSSLKDTIQSTTNVEAPKRNITGKTSNVSKVKRQRRTRKVND